MYKHSICSFCTVSNSKTNWVICTNNCVDYSYLYAEKFSWNINNNISQHVHKLVNLFVLHKVCNLHKTAQTISIYGTSAQPFLQHSFPSFTYIRPMYECTMKYLYIKLNPNMLIKPLRVCDFCLCVISRYYILS